jgi:hypothetical protein
LWLIDRGLVDSETLELEDIMAVMVEQIAVVSAEAGPDAAVEMLEGPRDILERHGVPLAAFVEQIWRAPTPSVSLVLDALAGCADKQLAKAARRARLKLNSAR